jgi:hypothetical protein
MRRCAGCGKPPRTRTSLGHRIDPRHEARAPPYGSGRSDPRSLTTYGGTAQLDPGFITDEGEYVGGTGFTSYSSTPSDSDAAYADVVMFEGEKPAAEVNAYDARSVLSARADHRGGAGGDAAHGRSTRCAATRS